MGCGGSKSEATETAHTEDEPEERKSRISERISNTRNSMAQRTMALGSALDGIFSSGKTWTPKEDYMGKQTHKSAGTHANYKTEAVRVALDADKNKNKK
jgi:hypothetical protein